MKKQKIILPSVGDRVKLKGRLSEGILYRINDETKWCLVDWISTGPKFCHLYELEKILPM